MQETTSTLAPLEEQLAGAEKTYTAKAFFDPFRRNLKTSRCQHRRRKQEEVRFVCA